MSAKWFRRGMRDTAGFTVAGEVIEITVIAELRRKGFSLQKIRRVLRFLQREMGKRLAEVMQAASELHLVTDGKSIYLEDQHERIIDILKNARQPMFLVCVSDQARRLADTERKPARMEPGIRSRPGPPRPRGLGTAPRRLTEPPRSTSQRLIRLLY